MSFASPNKGLPGRYFPGRYKAVSSPRRGYRFYYAFSEEEMLYNYFFFQYNKGPIPTYVSDFVYSLSEELKPDI